MTQDTITGYSCDTYNMCHTDPMHFSKFMHYGTKKFKNAKKQKGVNIGEYWGSLYM
jgi:hypothetical protein